MGAVGAVDNERGRDRDDGATDGAGADAWSDEAGRVARFLRRHPGWLAEQGGLYAQLEPPRRVHGERLADHMAAMIDAARQQADAVLRANRTARTLSQAVREAVLTLIAAPDLSEWLGNDLPRSLGVDGASLCAEPGTARTPGPFPGTLPLRPLPRGTVAALFGRGELLLRAAPADAALLHGELAAMARHDVLVRVAAPGGTPMLLALACRDDPGWTRSGSVHGSCEDLGSLGFLGQAIGARLAAMPAEPWA